MPRRVAAALGLGATVWFWAALFGFAALRNDGYSHLTKAVSELGVVGAPNMQAWNLLGFGLTGLLLAGFGWGLGRVADPEQPRTGLWLILSGLAFAAAAVPADMEALRSPGSLVHTAASLLMFVFWLPAAWRLSRRRSEWRALAIVSGAALWMALATMLLRFTPLPPPGLGQRVSFAVYFGWVAAASLLLWREGDRFRPGARPGPGRGGKAG